LNGVAIPTLVIALGLTAAWTVFSTALAVALGTQAQTRRGRTAAHLVAIGLLGVMSFMGVAFAAVLADEGERLLRDDDFLAFLAGMVAFTVSSSWLLVEGAAASLALPSEAASRGPRIALTVQVLGACALGAVGLVVFDSNKEGAAVASAAVGVLLAFAGTFAISENDGAPRAWANRGGWLRPGAFRSYVLVLVLALVSTAVWAAVFPSLSGHDSGGRRLNVVLAGSAYALFYLSLAAVLGRATPLARLGEPVATRAAMLGLVVAGTVISPLLALVASGRADRVPWNVFNPLLGIINFADRARGDEGRDLMLTLYAFTAMAVVAACVVLKSRDGVRQA
jgi:hypothetical protein